MLECVLKTAVTQPKAWVYKHSHHCAHTHTHINKQLSSSFMLKLNIVYRDRRTHMLHYLCDYAVPACSRIHSHSATIRASERTNDVKSASVEHLKSLIRIQIRCTNTPHEKKTSKIERRNKHKEYLERERERVRNTAFNIQLHIYCDDIRDGKPNTLYVKSNDTHTKTCPEQ